VPGNQSAKPIRVALVAEEPLRLAGLVSIFEAQAEAGGPGFFPVTGSLTELLTRPGVEFLIYDLNAARGWLETLELIRRERPDIPLIVIGPEGNDELVLNAIMAGARAYLDITASPQAVVSAMQAITAGSIWAPRRLLSKLIDRLLNGRDTNLATSSPHLTARERQVLELILMARSNREIASHLGIEERTVKAHVGRLMRKTGVDNRIELSMCALAWTAPRDAESKPAGTPGPKKDV